jgi:hypothetical protein
MRAIGEGERRRRVGWDRGLQTRAAMLAPVISDKGLPVVLAMTRHWTLEGESRADLDSIHEDLERLGALAVVRTCEGSWWLGPRGESPRFGLGADLDRRLALTVAMDAGHRRRSRRSSVFILDGQGTPRFGKAFAGDERVVGLSLVRGLSTARRTMVERFSAAAMSRVDVVVASLVAGFALSLGPMLRSCPAAPSDSARRLGT